MKIGFIGCGNMGKAIINGIISAQTEINKNIYASDNNSENLITFCRENGINACSDNTELISVCDYIVLSVKPQVFPTVLNEIKPALSDKSKTVISIAAGKSIKYIEGFLGDETKIIRVMPNLNATVSMSMSAYCLNKNCTPQDEEIIKTILNSIGSCVKINEEKFSIYSAVTCCSPAFTFMYIGALCEAGKEYGLDEDTALKCAVNSVIGSAQMLNCSSLDADTLVKKVCSPGGTTIEGVNILRDEKFENCVKKAVKASYEKDKKM